MKISVSVILPSLNVVNYIRQAVDSVLQQTLREIEIICVDAGSDDGTREILQELADGDGRIVIIDAEKKSYGYQMNIGVQTAKGEYIGIVETDDFTEPDMFEVLYHEAVQSGVDVVKAMLFEEYEFEGGYRWNRKMAYVQPMIPMNRVFSPDDHPEVHQYDGNIWNGIYRKDFLVDNEIRFNETPGASFQDIGFQQMVLNLADTMMYVGRFFYHYRVIRPGSSTWNNRCVRNIYNEYSRLLSDDRIKRSHLDYIYARMFPAFLYEYDKAMRYAGYDESLLECSEGVEWFRTMALSLLGKSTFATEVLNDYGRKQLISFLNHDGYIAGRKEWQSTVDECIETYIHRVREKGWVLFGCGRYGWQLLLFQLRNGAAPFCATDNNYVLWDEEFHGFHVLSPYDAAKRYPDAIYLVANKRSQDAIRQQLVSYNIPEENIVTFDGSNEQLMKIISEAPIIY